VTFLQFLTGRCAGEILAVGKTCAGSGRCLPVGVGWDAGLGMGDRGGRRLAMILKGGALR
jgi:hypothetical protein